MDFHKALRELYQEKKRLDAAIASLESRIRVMRPALASARRRRPMTVAERLRVSKRMKQYWEARRAQSQALEAASDSGPARKVSGASA